jgi:hypothetical protein
MRSNVLGGLLGALLGVAVNAGAASAAGAAKADEARFAPEELRADFAQMYGGLKAAHFDLYAFTPQPDLDRRYAQLLGQPDRPMTRLEAKVLFELFAAEVRMGHTRIDSPTAEWNFYRNGTIRSGPYRAAGRISQGTNRSAEWRSAREGGDA